LTVHGEKKEKKKKGDRPQPVNGPSAGKEKKVGGPLHRGKKRKKWRRRGNFGEEKREGRKKKKNSEKKTKEKKTTPPRGLREEAPTYFKKPRKIRIVKQREWGGRKEKNGERRS